MHIRSIRRFLLWSLIAAVVVSAGASAGWTYLQASHEVEELFDAELAQSARVLAGLADPELLRDHSEDLQEALARAGLYAPGASVASGEAPLPAGHPYETKLSFRIRHKDGSVLFSTPGAPDTGPLPPAPGYSWTDSGDVRWRIFCLRDTQDDLWIEVGQLKGIRDELSSEIAVDLFVQSLLAAPLLAILVPALVLAAFAPVQRIARQIDARAPSNLHPVDTGRAPVEIRSLVDALNRMFGRLSAAFEAERRFTADAAHELRTPIAGMLVHVENARRSRTDEARAVSLSRAADGVRRMQRLVEQLLTLSRLDPEAGLGEWEAVDLEKVAGEEAAQLSDRARDRDIELTVESDGVPRVRGNETMLGVLVRNLLDNALRHTPPSGQVTARLSAAGGRVQLTVDDTGPGIPEELARRVWERFYRAPGQTVDGAGLGLSIVSRVAAIHDASLEMINLDPGLSVRISFPAAGKTGSGDRKPSEHT
ncbi:MAG: ATP-binding protein [Gammaproteobacteria bacterium]